MVKKHYPGTKLHKNRQVHNYYQRQRRGNRFKHDKMKAWIPHNGQLYYESFIQTPKKIRGWGYKANKVKQRYFGKHTRQRLPRNHWANNLG